MGIQKAFKGKGIEDLEKEIKLKLVDFELLIDEAQSFHEACQYLNLIYPIVREHLKLSNKSLAGLDLKILYSEYDFSKMLFLPVVVCRERSF